MANSCGRVLADAEKRMLVGHRIFSDERRKHVGKYIIYHVPISWTKDLLPSLDLDGKITAP